MMWFNMNTIILQDFLYYSRVCSVSLSSAFDKVFYAVIFLGAAHQNSFFGILPLIFPLFFNVKMR